MTNSLLLFGGAAFFAIGFAVLLNDVMRLADPRQTLVDRQTGRIYRSREARVAWVIFVSVIAGAAMYLTFRFATDSAEMLGVNRAFFWLALAFEVALLVRALYRRFRRPD
jgi:divalent metal cation (Fe/Co/Zn/Cd) transporter